MYLMLSLFCLRKCRTTFLTHMVPRVMEVNYYFRFRGQLLFDISCLTGCCMVVVLVILSEIDIEHCFGQELFQGQTKQTVKILSRLVGKTFYLQVGLAKIEVSTNQI